MSETIFCPHCGNTFEVYVGINGVCECGRAFKWYYGLRGWEVRWPEVGE
jgi:hypothetical protein